MQIKIGTTAFSCRGYTAAGSTLRMTVETNRKLSALSAMIPLNEQLTVTVDEVAMFTAYRVESICLRDDGTAQICMSIIPADKVTELEAQIESVAIGTAATKEDVEIIMGAIAELAEMIGGLSE